MRIWINEKNYREANLILKSVVPDSINDLNHKGGNHLRLDPLCFREAVRANNLTIIRICFITDNLKDLAQLDEIFTTKLLQINDKDKYYCYCSKVSPLYTKIDLAYRNPDVIEEVRNYLVGVLDTEEQESIFFVRDPFSPQFSLKNQVKSELC